MHEYSISAEIAKTVLETAENNRGKKVLSVHLEIGELALLNVEQVKFWIDELFKGTVAEGAKVRVRKIKAEIECTACGYRGATTSDLKNSPNHVTLLSCPACGSFQIEIKKGRECLLRRIQAIK